jgi:putative heme iron utilization protein
MAESEQSDPGVTVRGLVRAAGQASLASALARDGSGRPYASLVLSACDHDGSPLLLLSDLADHSRNLAAEPRAALLFDGTAGRADPLTGPRASLLGEIRPIADQAQAARLAARYIARHPGAADYAGFADFRLYRMTVESAHLVAGFGRIHWLTGQEVLFDTAGSEALAEAEAEIVAHMNADHEAALEAIATRLLGLPRPDGPGAWVMTGIDPEGVDLRAGDRLARAGFAAPLSDAGAARAALIALTRQARDLSP